MMKVFSLIVMLSWTMLLWWLVIKVEWVGWLRIVGGYNGVVKGTVGLLREILVEFVIWLWQCLCWIDDIYMIISIILK
jgi:hypothetical protein